MLHFKAAERLSEAPTAAGIMSAYKGQAVNMRIDSQNFVALLVDVDAKGTKLKVTFSFKDRLDSTHASNEHIYHYTKTREGKEVTFGVLGADVEGTLEGFTTIPPGGMFYNYRNSEFSLLLNVLPDVKTAGSNSAIVGIEVPVNIQTILPFDEGLEYAPHITVAHFSSITKEEAKEVETLIRRAADRVGSFSVRVDRAITFPTEQDDGTYPWVALINSPMLLEFHDILLDLLEFHLPGLASMEFTHENFNPHTTLAYVQKPRQHVPVTPVAWTVDFVTLNASDPPVEVPLHRNRKLASFKGPYLQVGEERILIKKIKSDKNNHLKVKLRDTSQQEVLASLKDNEAQFVTKNSSRRLSVIKVRDIGNSTFDVYYRVTAQNFPDTIRKKLAKVSKELENRGELEIAKKVEKLLPEDTEQEDNDKEGFGPGSPGTFPQIVTYLKAPANTRDLDPNNPKFPKALDLVDRR